MISKFEQIFRKILAEHQSITDVDHSLICQESSFDASLEGTKFILNEYVKDPDFTPVPKQVLDKICSLAKFKKDNVVKISFREIYELLEEYDYEYYNEFKSNLLQRSLYDGSLCIVLLFDVDRDNVMPLNRTYAFINSYVEDENASRRMLEEILKAGDVDALCSVSDQGRLDDWFFNENAMIYVSLFGEFLKDSLEHELTHFVQRIVGFDKSLQKQFTKAEFGSFAMRDAHKAQILYDFISKLAEGDDYIRRMLIGFFQIKLNPRELDQSVKAILNGFQRIYEHNAFSFIGELDIDERRRNQLETKNDLSLRMKWVKDLLAKIESNEFLNDYLKPMLKQKNYDNEFFRKNRSFFFVILYLGIKLILDFGIKEKVMQHFNEFKFRDN